MYVNHPSCESPKNKDAQVWRYMDFTKFVSLLEKKSLYFTRVDKFDDPFEGSYSKANVVKRLKMYTNLPEHLFGDMSIDYKIWPKFTFLNCWHLNNFESAAMWKLYLKSDEGISVQSNFERLTKSFDKCTDHDTFVGKVKYIDYNVDFIPDNNMLNPFLHKRQSFEHEKEIRAIVVDIPIKDEKVDLNSIKYPHGIYVPIDLDILIEKIYVSPTSPDWFYTLVKSITKKYEIDKDVVKSNISDDPVF